MGRKNKKRSVITKKMSIVSLFNRNDKASIQSQPHLEIEPYDKAYIYQSEISFIGKCILDYPNIETGGQLFGYWTASGAPVVVYAIGPGPNANHQVAFFNQDVQYLERVGHILVSQFGLMHIGEWHSHHHLGLDKPSAHDANTMQKSIDRLHLNRFLLCIGNCNGSQYSIRPYNFIENYNVYSNAEWEIKGEVSPYRSQIQSYLAYTFQIQSYLANLEFATRQSEHIEKSWFAEQSNRRKLTDMIGFMKSLPGSSDSKAQLVGETVQLLTTFYDRIEVISFPSNFPSSPISINIKYHASEAPITKSMSEKEVLKLIPDADLFESFKQQYNSLTHDYS